MRPAAKAAGLAVIGSCRSVSSSVAPGEHVVTSRNSVISVPSIASASANGATSSTFLNSPQNASIQRPFREINEWEFMGEEEEEERIFDLMNREPRRVFLGAVPSIEEAKEATSDLKDALNKIYFSSPTAVGGGSSSMNAQESMSPGSLDFDNRACVTTGSDLTRRSEPKHVLRAFSLLQENSHIQNVVTSLASDQNVWKAVMGNTEVMEFYKSMNKDADASHAGTEGETSSRDGYDEKSNGSLVNGVLGFMERIKLKVLLMVTNLSEFLGRLFGNLVEGIGSANASTKTTSTVTSLIALAISAIMVIMVKRA